MRKIWLGLFALLLIGNVYAADQWDKTDPAGTASPSDLDTIIQANNNATDRLLYGYRSGCKMAYLSAATLTVEAGELALPNAAGTIVRDRRNPTATTVTWSDIDTGAEAASTTYYVYGLADADATTFTVKISASSSAPSGGTYYRKLGSFYNDGSSNIGGIKDDSTSQFGTWTSKSSGVVYQATTDGFVTAWADAAGNGGNLIGYTDSSSSPSTIRAKTGDAPHDGTSHQMSIMFPVKSRDYYEVTASYWSPTIYFISKE